MCLNLIYLMLKVMKTFYRVCVRDLVEHNIQSTPKIL